MALAQYTSPQPASLPQREERKRHLTPVAPGTRALPGNGALGLVIIAILAVLGIFAAQLWLSVATSQGAYTANDLILEERELARIERVMQQEVYVASSPQNLSQKATAQGMVQNARPAYLALDGSVIQGDLTQSTTAARANIVPNAALVDYNTPLAQQIQNERAVLAAKKAEAEKIAAAEALEAEKTTAAAVPRAPKPTGPVAWSEALPAPATH